MKKLLVLAALSAMAMGAKAEYTYTVNFPGAQSVWTMGTDYSTVGVVKEFYFDNKLEETWTWAEQYAVVEEELFGGEKFAGSDGAFSYTSDSASKEWYLLVTDAAGVIPGASYSVYYGTSYASVEYEEFGGAITINGEPILTGTWNTDGAAPVPEPTSGLLLLLGVAGLALKRKRA